MAALVCRTCSAEHSTTHPLWKCPCGGLLDLEFKAEFPIDKIQKRNKNLWRYREALPLENDQPSVSFGEGLTPLVPLEINVDGRSILIKHDHLFPTGSFKDRGASILMSKVKELGIDHIVEDSSGNAGCAIAAYAALARISCDIYLPMEASPEKTIQIEMSGAKIHRIPGGREAVASAALEAAEDHYYASHCWNPYFFHGTKTFAFEICEQLDWEAPDAVILPVGNGTLALGAYIGFRELLEADVIHEIPRIIAVQSERCDPLSQAFHLGGNAVKHGECRETVAEGIAIPTPIRGEQIVEAVRKTGGSFLSVTEEEIITSLGKMIDNGFLIEPTSAATIAGVEKFIRQCDPDPDATIVSTFTGHGSNTAEKIERLLS